MRLIKKYISFLFFSLLLSLFTSAQVSISNFNTLTYKDGLTDNNIKTIVQDDMGYLWIGTEYGLNRFDGKQFKQFYRGDKNLGLPGNHISYLKNLGNNEIGICTRNGFELLNTKTFEHKRYLVADTGSFTTKQNETWDVCKMPNDRIAITTATGFYVFNKDGSIYFRYDYFKPSQAGKVRMLYGREIFKLSNEEYIIFTQGDSYAYFNLATKEYLQVTDATKNPFPFCKGRNISRNKISQDELLILQYTTDTIVYYNHRLKKTVYSKLPFDVYYNIPWYAKIRKYDDSSFIINATNGFYKLTLDTKTGKVKSENKQILTDVSAFCHFTDRDGRLWLGTNNALYKEQKAKPAITTLEVKHKIKENYITSIKPYKGKLYIGNYAKGDSALWIVNASSKRVERKIMFYDSKSDWNEISSINQYHQDTLWIGTRAGTLWFSTSSFKYGKLIVDKSSQQIVNNPLLHLGAVDNRGIAWITVAGSSKLISYNVNSRSFYELNGNTTPAVPITDIKFSVLDSYGNLWIAGNDIACYNTTKKTFDTVITQFAGADKYSRNVIAFSADNNGSLWMQTANNDFLEYRINDRKFIVYNEATGFPPGDVLAISEVVDNKIWMQQPNRLLLYDTRTKSYQTFSINDGMPDDRPIIGSISYDYESQLFYTLYQSSVGIINYNQSMDKNNVAIIIDAITINNAKQIFHPESTFTTTYNQNDINISFSVLDFDNGSNYIFHYKVDKGNWIFIKEETQLRLGELKNGRHDIVIKTTDKTGNEVFKQFTIMVKPPFWKSIWFFAALFFLAAFVLVSIYRNRIKKVHSKAVLDSRVARSEMRALHSQMNPHFIFNSLNSIKDLILHNKNDGASRYLSKFAQLIRLNLEHSKEPISLMKETIEYLGYYLEMEQLRFDNLEYSMHVEDGIDIENVFLPSMFFQPIVENAIWHGLLSLPGKKKISIAFFKDKDELFCTIEDNGIGIKESASRRSNNTDYQSTGLENIKQRLKLISDEQGKSYGIKIEDKTELTNGKDQGTIVTINLPINLNPYD